MSQRAHKQINDIRIPYALTFLTKNGALALLAGIQRENAHTRMGERAGERASE